MGWQRVREHSRDAAALVPELARSALRPPARQAPAPREGPRSARSHWPAGRRRPHAPGLPPLPPRSTLPEAVQFPESQWPRGILVHCLLWLGFLQQRTGREQVRGWGVFLSPTWPSPSHSPASMQSYRMKSQPLSLAFIAHHKLALICLPLLTPYPSQENPLVAPGIGQENVSRLLGGSIAEWVGKTRHPQPGYLV